MHTPVSVLAGISVLAVVAGGYVLYWNWSVYRAIPDRLMRARAAWIGASVFFLVITLGSVAIGDVFHVDLVAFRGFSGTTSAVSAYASGDRTIKVAYRYDFARKRRGVPERLVRALSPLVWPWMIFIFSGVPFLNLVISHPLVSTLARLVIPLVGIFSIVPIIVAGLLSATRWTVDPRLRQNMRWLSSFILSIIVLHISGYFLERILGSPLEVVTVVALIPFLLVFYTGYKSSKSLITTHKLPSVS